MSEGEERWGWRTVRSRGVPIAGLVLAATAAGLLAVWLLAPPTVELTLARTGTIRELVQGPGTVQAHIATTVGSRITGVVTATLVDQGATVTKGDLLALLEEGDLRARVDAARAAVVASRDGILAAEAMVERAAAELELARVRHARVVELSARGVLSRDELDGITAALRTGEAAAASTTAELAAARSRTTSAEAELRYAQAVLSYTRIEAPADGFIVAREAELGDTVLAGAPIYQMIDPATLWVVMRLDESVVGRVRPGQPAAIQLRSGALLDGHVARIGHRSDATMRELEVDVAFEQRPPRVVINEEARVAITVTEQEGTTIPRTALASDGKTDGVLVPEAGRAVFRRVTVGPGADEEVLIEEGLRPGEAVLRFAAGIEPGQRVKTSAAPQR